MVYNVYNSVESKRLTLYHLAGVFSFFSFVSISTRKMLEFWRKLTPSQWYTRWENNYNEVNVDCCSLRPARNICVVEDAKLFVMSYEYRNLRGHGKLHGGIFLMCNLNVVFPHTNVYSDHRQGTLEEVYCRGEELE